LIGHYSTSTGSSETVTTFITGTASKPGATPVADSDGNVHAEEGKEEEGEGEGEEKERDGKPGVGNETGKRTNEAPGGPATRP